MSTENAPVSEAVVATESAPESAPQASSPQQASSTPQAENTLAKRMQAKAVVDSQPPPAPSFQPNFKFKVHDEEKEIDEMFRGLIKDQDTEKKIRELHEKAYGLDVQKPKYERMKQEFQEVSTKYGNIDKSLKQLSSYVQAGDLGSFFQATQIPKQMIFEYVKKELELMEASPEQRAEVERVQAERRRLYNLEQENQDLKTRFETESQSARVMELTTALASPVVSSVAQSFDAKMGSGAFKMEVIKHGLAVSQTTGETISVQQAVQETVEKWKQFFGETQQASTPGASPMETASQAQAAPKPTLPNVSGRSASPLKAGPRSIDDLKKIAAAKSAQL